MNATAVTRRNRQDQRHHPTTKNRQGMAITQSGNSCATKSASNAESPAATTTASIRLFIVNFMTCRISYLRHLASREERSFDSPRFSQALPFRTACGARSSSRCDRVSSVGAEPQADDPLAAIDFRRGSTDHPGSRSQWLTKQMPPAPLSLLHSARSRLVTARSGCWFSAAAGMCILCLMMRF